MPEISRRDLSAYRLGKAYEMLLSADRDMSAGDYASANNRAYYSVFHSMRAVLAMDGEFYRAVEAYLKQERWK